MSLYKSLKKTFYLIEDRALIQEDQLDINSLDAQIDKYLSTYENESQKNETPNESFSPTLKSWYSNMFETKEDVHDLVSKITGEKPDEDEDEDVPEQELEPDIDDELPPELADIGKEPAQAQKKNQDKAPPAEALPDDTDNADDTLPDNLGDEEQDIEEPDEPEVVQRPGQLDISSFATQVDNLVTNAVNLLDIKGVIIQRAIDIVKKNYGDKDAEELAQTLKTNYNLSNDDIDEDE